MSEKRPLNLLLGVWNSPTMMGGYYAKSLKKIAKVWTVGPKVSQSENDFYVDIHEPITPILSKINEPIDFYISFYSKPDFFPIDMYKLPIPTAWYVYDTHLHLHELSTTAYLFDHIFCTDEPTRLRLQQQGVSHLSVLPFAADKDYYYRPQSQNLNRPYDVGFCGSITNHPALKGRKELIEQLQKKFSLKVENRSLFGNEVADFYQQCKVVLNHAIADDYNMRVAEALLSGRPLLTPKVTGIEAFVQDGVHASVYEAHNLEAKLQHLLDHPNEAEAMAQKGQEEFLNKHTYDHRAQTLTQALNELVEKYQNEGRPHKNPWLKRAAQFRYHYFRYPGDALSFLLQDPLQEARLADRLLFKGLTCLRKLLRFLDRLRGSEHFQKSH